MKPNTPYRDILIKSQTAATISTIPPFLALFLTYIAPIKPTKDAKNALIPSAAKPGANADKKNAIIEPINPKIAPNIPKTNSNVLDVSICTTCAVDVVTPSKLYPHESQKVESLLTFV